MKESNETLGKDLVRLFPGQSLFLVHWDLNLIDHELKRCNIRFLRLDHFSKRKVSMAKSLPFCCGFEICRTHNKTTCTRGE